MSFINKLQRKVRTLSLRPRDNHNSKAACAVPPGKVDFSDVVTLLEEKVGFGALKLAHGFWEHCSMFLNDLKNAGVLDCEDREEWKSCFSKYSSMCPWELFVEITEILSNADKDPSFKIFVSCYGWRNGGDIEGTPMVGRSQVESAIDYFVQGKVELSDALFLKEAAYDLELDRLLKTIQDYDVIIVGPDYVRNFGYFAKFTNWSFVAVSERNAAWEREKILSAVEDRVLKAQGRYVVCLIEAGGATSAWLSYRLHKQFPDNAFLPMGQTLNLCNISKIENINWFKMYRREICQCIKQINPEWTLKDEAFTSESRYFDCIAEKRWECLVNGYDITGLALAEKEKISDLGEPPVAFIENKDIDFSIVQEVLGLSKGQNHWANFGPVSVLLEKYISQLIHLDCDKRVVMCKSGTEALLTLVSLANLKSGKRLRWVVSAFGFIASNIGVLSDAHVVDCDEDGILSFEDLLDIPIDSWDGVILTNPFGVGSDFSRITAYCNENGKELIVDNATALFTPTRNRNSSSEVVSFHQTKPWGQGEGGCAILPAEDEPSFRSLLNFGVGLDDNAREYARNGKISDFSCALIYQRLVRLPGWERGYILQARKVWKAVQDSGLQLLSGTNNNQITGHLPVLFDKPVSKSKIVNPVCTLRKYYNPLSNKHPRANDIFGRIVNVPCHPGMAAVSEDALRQLLIQLSLGDQ
ncbi:DegT/DnrJ/EryC1/StrS family aminotransferase [uncultured Pseudodesulfovibrio sp.]|uniref:DegT/DnrJ/EryC1/StrS family aminotransferase n=1 Tax=uncultured Pseudodesulfovibrio sp. TaxID=2035858 RepID=UPI003748A65C